MEILQSSEFVAKIYSIYSNIHPGGGGGGGQCSSLLLK